MMLHTVNKSPFERNTLDSCLRLAKSGSSVLLIEDAVIAALAGTEHAKKLAAAMSEHKIYVLKPDLKARGIQDQPLLDGVTTVDYAGFVDLTVEHDCVQSWL
jgi:tRNA 2-thiouridine synthesizing protein B